MEIIKVNKAAPSPSTVKKIVRTLKNGGIIAYSTDTAYGLGAVLNNKNALKKIFKIKKRPSQKRLGLIASDLKQVKRFFVLNKREIELARKYWPGPLSVILKSKKGKSAAVRVPALKLARLICQKIGQPISSTSLNLAGKNECYSLSDFKEQFKNQKYLPDLFLDSGRLKKLKPSTLVKVTSKKIKILRPGPIKIE